MKSLKKFILALILLIVEFTYSAFILLILQKIGFAFNSVLSRIILSVVTSIIFMIIIFLIYRKDLIKEAKLYKDNFKSYFLLGLKAWIIGITLMFIANILVFMVYHANATNEEIVQSYLKAYPLYIIFSSLIYSPFIEEIIFRKSIRGFIKNNYLYILVAGLIFGYAHTLANTSNLMELLYIIPYGIMGAAFAYTYVKTDSIFVSMTFHFLHNLLVVIMSITPYIIGG